MCIRDSPYNYYAILTMVMSLFLIFSGLDYGPMKKHEDNALLGDLFTTDDRPYGDDVDDSSDTRGHVEMCIRDRPYTTVPIRGGSQTGRPSDCT